MATLACFQGGEATCSLSPKSHRYYADLVDTKGLLTWPITGYTYVILRTGCPNDRLRHGATCANVRETVKYWKWFYSSKSVTELAGDYRSFDINYSLKRESTQAVVADNKKTVLCVYMSIRCYRFRCFVFSVLQFYIQKS